MQALCKISCALLLLMSLSATAQDPSALPRNGTIVPLELNRRLERSSPRERDDEHSRGDGLEWGGEPLYVRLLCMAPD